MLVFVSRDQGKVLRTDEKGASKEKLIERE